MFSFFQWHAVFFNLYIIDRKKNIFSKRSKQSKVFFSKMASLFSWQTIKINNNDKIQNVTVSHRVERKYFFSNNFMFKSFQWQWHDNFCVSHYFNTTLSRKIARTIFPNIRINFLKMESVFRFTHSFHLTKFENKKRRHYFVKTLLIEPCQWQKSH